MAKNVLIFSFIFIVLSFKSHLKLQQKPDCNEIQFNKSLFLYI